MSYQYRITATIERKTTDKRWEEWTRTTSVPTFLLSADVQGIVSDDHACRIATDLLNPWKDETVTVYCTAMRVHVNYWPSQEYCTDCAKEQCSEIGHIPKVLDKEDESSWVQTACGHCGADIEGQPSEGNWRDRGNNAHCSDGTTHDPDAEESDSDDEE